MNKQSVVALIPNIPNQEKPPRFVLSEETGKPPIVERLDGISAEAMLPYIGRMALCSYYLSVNYGRQDLRNTFTEESAWVLETKPVPLDILNAGYIWGEL